MYSVRLIITGCEYTGKTSLSVKISEWMIDVIGLPFVRWHDHFVPPFLDRHTTIVSERQPSPGLGKKSSDEFDKDDLEQVSSLRPLVLEQFQRHNIWRHVHPSGLGAETDFLVLDFYYAEAVYAPIYYGYGERKSFSDRSTRAREWDAELLKFAPDVILVLTTASPVTIKTRMASNPHLESLVKEPDVEMILDRFEEEFTNSSIKRRLKIDTSGYSVEESLVKFKEAVSSYLTSHDRLRIQQG